jgi:hypothetical protein
MHKVPNFPKQVNMNTPLISLCNMNTVDSQFIQIRYYTNKYYTKVYIKNKSWWKCSYNSYLHHLSEIQTLCEKVPNIEENTAQQKKPLLYLPHDDKNIPFFLKRISQCHYFCFKFVNLLSPTLLLWKQNLFTSDSRIRAQNSNLWHRTQDWKYLLQNLRIRHF